MTNPYQWGDPTASIIMAQFDRLTPSERERLRRDEERYAATLCRKARDRWIADTKGTAHAVDQETDPRGRAGV